MVLNTEHECFFSFVFGSHQGLQLKSSYTWKHQTQVDSESKFHAYLIKVQNQTAFHNVYLYFWTLKWTLWDEEKLDDAVFV